MHFESELLPNVWHISLPRFQDKRGILVKTFSQSVYQKHGININWREEFYSFSNKDVVRGMHFQTPPADHFKLIYCASGSVIDVLLDLRKGPGYGKVAHVKLESDKPSVIVMPPGIAHGFRSLVDHSLMVYKTSTEYSMDQDAGIHWDSFSFDWGLDHPITSDRDAGHISFLDFVSPF
ncbi:dTDP-4-dehydrorhamnose 3,5-epimerase family protein [Polynucleobacter yangtzensis]|uniref:dTDP-4-dehydrorhamnose 3,5-epimerase n=1 Tax=Polynucleobacter yangtzensis TaxID=1743159 RepID=A0ABM8CKV9_9BURK|nr:dTDP-4-dehydrorhamnose 3,5-epimerase family protein [Polynucleobacter yangtzensis]BDT78439.1 dTDP-4-dehydrorhamnose 3,5-epimerase [Polynucleobacter yangtzensis]